MTSSRASNKNGFTVLELLFAGVVMLIIAAATYSAFRNFTVSAKRMQGSLEHLQDNITANRIMWLDFKNVAPSFNNIRLPGEEDRPNSAHFYDYAPGDDDCTGRSDRPACTRNFVLNKDNINSYFFALVDDDDYWSPQPIRIGCMVRSDFCDPATTVNTPTEIIPDWSRYSPDTFKKHLIGLGGATALFPRVFNQRILTKGRIIMMHLPEPIINEDNRKPYLYQFVTQVSEVRGSSDGRIDNDSFYRTSLAGDKALDGLDPKQFQFVRNSHPIDLRTEFRDITDFLHKVPLGINADTLRVRPLKAVIYYLRPGSRRGLKLFRRELGFNHSILLSDTVKSVEFRRQNVTIPSISTQITFEETK